MFLKRNNFVSRNTEVRLGDVDASLGRGALHPWRSKRNMATAAIGSILGGDLDGNIPGLEDGDSWRTL
jgi:hypothetical protein